MGIKVKQGKSVLVIFKDKLINNFINKKVSLGLLINMVIDWGIFKNDENTSSPSIPKTDMGLPEIGARFYCDYDVFFLGVN